MQKLGQRFAELLLSDAKMSNPGHNGISISIEELQSSPEAYDFLIEAVDYGNLIMTEHANRSGRRRRLKFYLNPLYCPIFRIPFQRTKEPLYLSIEKLEDWLIELGVINAPPRARAASEMPPAPLLDLIGGS